MPRWRAAACAAAPARPMARRPGASSGCSYSTMIVDVALAALEPALGQQQRLGAGHRAVALVDLGPHDQVDHAGLVLQQQEHDAVGGGRALAGDHQPGHATSRAVGGSRAARRRRAHAGAGPGAPARPGASRRQAGGLVVGDRALQAPELGQRRRGVRRWRRASWRAAGAARAGGRSAAELPEQRAARRRRRRRRRRDELVELLAAQLERGAARSASRGRARPRRARRPGGRRRPRAPRARSRARCAPRRPRIVQIRPRARARRGAAPRTPRRWASRTRLAGG